MRHIKLLNEDKEDSRQVYTSYQLKHLQEGSSYDGPLNVPKVTVKTIYCKNYNYIAAHSFCKTKESYFIYNMSNNINHAALLLFGKLYDGNTVKFQNATFQSKIKEDAKFTQPGSCLSVVNFGIYVY